VLVTAGGQNALHAILSATMRQGDAIACAQYVYPGFRAVAERLGIELVPLAELSGSALRSACTRQPIRGLYVVPTNDNPTTRTLSADARRDLADVAEEFGLQVVEDDAYGALSTRPLAPLASLIPHRSWYVASTSKIISPALRVAFVRAPSIAAALRLAADVHETTIMAPPLNVAVVSGWIADGTYGRLLDLMRTEAQRRLELAHRLLGGLDYDCHPQGYHLWMRLGPGLRASDLVEAMRPTGLSVIAAERFAAGPVIDQAVRVSLGGLLSNEQLGRGLAILQAHAAPSRSAALV
jgi:DNA-binding transcriptional MocR family regulator